MLNTWKYVTNKILENKGFVVFLLLFFTMRWSFADHYRVPTGSMKPTVQIGDHVFVNKMAYDLKLPFTDIVLSKMGNPESGDIVIFKYPLDPSTNFLKRVIGIPGDEIEVLHGMVKINGRALTSKENVEKLFEAISNKRQLFQYKETIVDKEVLIQRIPNRVRPQHFKVTIPSGYYFVMGDNRDNSGDSREWGLVPRDHFKGRASAVTISVAIEDYLPIIRLSRFGKALI